MFTLRTGGFCLCLLSACMIAAAVYTWTDDWDVTAVFGAELHDDCKEPCDDTFIHYILECADFASEPGCRDNECFLNSLRYLECTTEDDAEPEADDCDWGTDPNDWSRWVVHREMECDDDGPHTHTYDECVGSPYASEYTPCVVGSCYGTEINSWAEEQNRAICN